MFLITITFAGLSAQAQEWSERIQALYVEPRDEESLPWEVYETTRYNYVVRNNTDLNMTLKTGGVQELDLDSELVFKTEERSPDTPLEVRYDENDYLLREGELQHLENVTHLRMIEAYHFISVATFCDSSNTLDSYLSRHTDAGEIPWVALYGEDPLLQSASDSLRTNIRYIAATFMSESIQCAADSAGLSLSAEEVMFVILPLFESIEEENYWVKIGFYFDELAGGDAIWNVVSTLKAASESEGLHNLFQTFRVLLRRDTTRVQMGILDKDLTHVRAAQEFNQNIFLASTQGTGPYAHNFQTTLLEKSSSPHWGAKYHGSGHSDDCGNTVHYLYREWDLRLEAAAFRNPFIEKNISYWGHLGTHRAIAPDALIGSMFMRPSLGASIDRANSGSIMRYNAEFEVRLLGQGVTSLDVGLSQMLFQSTGAGDIQSVDLKTAGTRLGYLRMGLNTRHVGKDDQGHNYFLPSSWAAWYLTSRIYYGPSLLDDTHHDSKDLMVIMGIDVLSFTASGFRETR